MKRTTGFILLTSDDGSTPPVGELTAVADTATIVMTAFGGSATGVPSPTTGAIIEAFPEVVLILGVRLTIVGGR